MIWSLRRRLIASLAPVGILLAALGAVGLAVLWHTGGRIDAIIKENYVSVRAMDEMNERLERIDSSFQFALSGREGDAKAQFAANWVGFESQFHIEEENITIFPAEQELVEGLRSLKTDYRARGERFYARPSGSPDRRTDYFGKPGLLSQFSEIKTVIAEILRINQENMFQARDEAKATARIALIGLGAALALIGGLLFGVTWYLLHTIPGPIRLMTEAAQEIGGGHLDREVPVVTHDELGRLAQAFNAMTRQLRVYRQTDLSRLLRAQQTAQATIDSFPDPILVVDIDGHVELANPAARSLLGVGSSATWIPPEPLRQPVHEALTLQRPRLAEGFDQAITFQTGGEDRSYLPQIRPIRDANGDTTGAAVVLNDITRFRLLDQFKSDLVATVSHELKTPLTSVRLAVHVLLEESIGPLTAKQTEMLLDARENSERLLRLIDHLLALARLERSSSATKFVTIDPMSILERVATEAQGRAEDKHVEMIVEKGEPLPPVSGDPERLALAVANLVENAVTYTPTGGKVTLSALAADGRVVFAVADTGPGIPAEHLPHVFERFFRVPGQSAEGGTGLGLSIVKEIVDAHHGEVSCESTPGHGSVFRIALPAGV
ncbi:MAG TPA: ATP-binding protein [Gemmataceae bacterium]|jgi:PAS domain S-box-containing protein|nr:ATP-binding protein [Gemmataceae bacterium]